MSKNITPTLLGFRLLRRKTRHRVWPVAHLLSYFFDAFFRSRCNVSAPTARCSAQSKPVAGENPLDFADIPHCDRLVFSALRFTGLSAFRGRDHHPSRVAHGCNGLHYFRKRHSGGTSNEKLFANPRVFQTPNAMLRPSRWNRRSSPAGLNSATARGR